MKLPNGREVEFDDTQISLHTFWWGLTYSSKNQRNPSTADDTGRTEELIDLKA